MATASSAQPANGDQTRRIYELETTIAQLRDANTQSQAAVLRLERDRQRTEEELDALNKAHSRLETQLFEAESQLGAASSKLDRTRRVNTTMQSTLEARVASLEREREGLKKKEAELAADLAAAKRRATIQRRQTVSATSGHTRSGSTAGTASFGGIAMFTHDVPSPFSGPAYQADAQADASAGDQQARQMQAQISQLSRKLRETEDLAQQANDQAARIHAEAEHALGAFDAHRQRIDDLETTVKQLSELNESLREDNESYQMLLQMSTMKGGLSFGNNARRSLESRSSSGKWAASPDGGGSPDGNSAFNYPASPDIGLDLASELGQALSLDEAHADGSPIAGDLAPDADTRSSANRSRIPVLEEKIIQLKEELRKTKYDRRRLSDENKAMSLYINKILARIMASPNGLEAILSNDYEKKPGSIANPKQPLPSSSSVSANKLVRKEDPRTPTKCATMHAKPPQHRPSLSLAAQGSGDGITSVFIPPTSPAMQHANPPLLPVKQLEEKSKEGEDEQEQEHVPPPYTRRVRSATVAVDMVPDIKLVNRSAGAATISNGSSGTWWRRMSVLRIGGAWNAPDDAGADQQQQQQ
ncbi:hypothetical protein GGI23_005571 [Coemansia sp. RSA 2559]|nr:hypothetical protein GGI23_005571 [Coemansia sp. RSA 2559]KAJ2853140.1 hypothetical protein GGI22_004987 [Coemansia erecta]